jgi:lysozyme
MTVTGIDISEFQGNWTPTKSIAQGAQFVFIRGGQGNKYQDAKYAENVRKAKAAGMPYGVYHVAQPGGDWAKQAAFALALGCDAPLGIWLDIELDGSLSNDQLGNWLSKYTAAVDAESVAGIYTRASWWDAKVPRNDWAKKHDLWIANYTTASAPLMPKDWSAINNPKTWLFWQWYADGNGLGSAYGVESHSIDLNRFNGDLATFIDVFDLSIIPVVPPVVPPPTPPPATLPETVKVNVDLLNVRDRIWGNVVVKLPKGFAIHPEAMGKDSAGKPWYRSGPCWFAGWLVE